MNQLKSVKSIVDQLNFLNEKSSKLSWVKYTTGFDFGLYEVQKEIQKILENKDNFKTILDCKNEDLSLDNKRRITLLENRFKPYHLSSKLNKLSEKIQQKRNKLSHVLNNHRSKINGREVSSVEINRILAVNPDRKVRKAAFLAQTQVNEVLIKSGFIELLNLRKDFAELYGAKDFVEYSLEQQELNPSIFDSWEDDLRQSLPEIKRQRAEYAEKYLGNSELKPWDEAFLRSKIAPSLNSIVDMTNFLEPIKKLFSKFGIDISNDNTTYDIFPRKNKSEWGYNFTISPGKDSRVLANVQNKLYEFRVLLHETGHAMHYFRLDSEDTLMNWGVSGIISEGIANLFGGFLYEKEFLQQFFTDQKIDNVASELQEYKEFREISQLYAINSILFDQKLYKKNLNNLNEINDLYWQNFMDLFDEEPYNDQPAWGYMIHHTTHPIYLHNYFMGDVTCEMLKQNYCKKKKIKNILDDPLGFGNFLLNDIIKLSGKYTFSELFKRISGEDFSLKYVL